MILENPNERQPLHEKFDGHHSPELRVPGLFIATSAQPLHDVGEQGKLASLEG